MHLKRLVAGCFAAMVMLYGHSAGQYYYSAGEKIPLLIDSTKITIK